MVLGVLPVGYDPDLIPESADGTDDGSYDPETGVVAGSDESMDDEEFRYVVKQAIESAQTYIDSYLAPARHHIHI